MKNSWKLAALAIGAMLLTGCITATVVMSVEATEEKKEICGGRVFEVETGTIEYASGDVLAFRDYGKSIRVDKANGDFYIITLDKVYYCFTFRKEYIEKPNTDGTYYYSNLSYVFPTKWFRLEKFADDMVEGTNNSESIGTYCGLKCVVFRENETNYEVAGSKRMYIYKQERGDVIIRALNYTTVCTAEFKVPSDYVKIEGSIDYGERF